MFQKESPPSSLPVLSEVSQKLVFLELLLSSRFLLNFAFRLATEAVQLKLVLMDGVLLP